MKNTLVARLRAFRPPLLGSILAAAIFSTLSLLYVATDLLASLPFFIGYILYVLAAAFLSCAVWAVVLALKKSPPRQMLLAAAGRHKFTARLTRDYAYRTILFATISLLCNTVLVLSKMLMGWYYCSVWLMVLSGYYIVLCVSKFLLLWYGRGQARLADEKSARLHEWKAYRLCGIMLLIMTIFLQGVVIMIVKDGMGFSYVEIVVIAIAAYDFYCLINAMLYMIAKRKNHSPLVNAIKSISLASSLVAILSLQTAMFASFGAKTDAAFRQMMNILTGSAVCILMIALGLFMIIKANKQLQAKRYRQEE